MNVVLGFGRTEHEFEEQEFKFVEQFLIEKANSFVGDKINFDFSDELILELEQKLKERESHFKQLDEEYKTSKEYPNRYSTYFFNVLTDKYSDLCVVFKFSHISRNHTMSPDGWALLTTKKVYYADIWDFRD